jgi:hypothetical protein
VSANVSDGGPDFFLGIPVSLSYRFSGEGAIMRDKLNLDVDTGMANRAAWQRPNVKRFAAGDAEANGGGGGDGLSQATTVS